MILRILIKEYKKTLMRSTYRSRQIEKSNLNTSKTPWFFKNPISSKPNTNLQLYHKKSVSQEMKMKIRFKKDNSSLSSHKKQKKNTKYFFQKQNMSWSCSRSWFRTGTACLRKKPLSFPLWLSLKLALMIKKCLVSLYPSLFLRTKAYH